MPRRSRPSRPHATFRFEGASRGAQDTPANLERVERHDDGPNVLVVRLVIGEPITPEIINALNDLARGGADARTPPRGVSSPAAPARRLPNGDGGGPRHRRP